MLISGFILGFVTFLSFALSYHHAAAWFKWWCVRHPLICDIAASATCYVLLAGISGTIVAVVAMITAGLLINASLIHLAKKGAINDKSLQPPPALRRLDAERNISAVPMRYSYRRWRDWAASCPAAGGNGHQASADHRS
jgi:hypothetical protein